MRFLQHGKPESKDLGLPQLKLVSGCARIDADFNNVCHSERPCLRPQAEALSEAEGEEPALVFTTETQRHRHDLNNLAMDAVGQGASRVAATDL